MKTKSVHRCSWCVGKPLYEEYHDIEWGVPVYDDQKHFEFLVLESAQAGLSWYIILQRRGAYKKAFADFNPKKVAKFTDAKAEQLLINSGIIKNRAKIVAAINNAKCFLEIQKEFGSFTRYIWSFVGNRVIDHTIIELKNIPVTTPESDNLAKDMKKRGFKFLGSTTLYAHMQACGLFNDHTAECFRYRQVKKLEKKPEIQ